ncbi:hypothetical protein DH2020_038326 [Rehmannia glutinosa]|uniref:C2 domain-containing protein n=1 Tax=Rehmannia glutinosa TaxID=99300 RepID=A0ABR0V050_REHGL
MGNCCSDVSGGKSAVGGNASTSAANSATDAIDAFLRSRGYNGLFSQIEVFTCGVKYKSWKSKLKGVSSYTCLTLESLALVFGLRLTPHMYIGKLDSTLGNLSGSVYIGNSMKASTRRWPLCMLSLSAANLRDRDVLSKSDPMAVLYMKGRDGSLQELGRTEVVLNSLSPRFRVYDVDTQFHNVDVKVLKLEEQQFLGEASCTLSELVTKLNRTLTLDLAHEEGSIPAHIRKSGQLTIYAEESVASKTTAELMLRCSDLEAKDLFSKSDPFLVISKFTENGVLVPICKTEVLKNDHNPRWKQILLSIQQVGSKDSPLTIECFNFNSNGKHDLLGKVQKSLAGLEKLHSVAVGESLVIPVSVGQSHQNKVLKSQLFVDKYSENTQHTFLDYLAGGYELNFMVAIDFTVGGLLQFYDSDKKFPAWGFGARPIDGPVSHCFNLNGSSNYCEVDGIHGIMTAYTSALFNVSLAGPTLFGHVVTNAAQIASASVAKNERKYFVLLIITDGVITDLQETKDAFVMASDLPLSILIVGVGGADFKEMEILDADKGERLESSTGRVASRDIVQFVPCRDVQSGEISVVQSLLAELPSQFLKYVRARGIVPNA